MTRWQRRSNPVTDPLYHRDAYEKEFAATVIAVEGNAVALDRTAFYPGGGGQPNDVGTLVANGGILTVTKVRKGVQLNAPAAADIWHEVAGDPPTVGAPVRGAIDWERRHQLMRTHTAMHILCGVIFRDYGASVTGGNMEPLKGRMDFEFETMRLELVKEIEVKVNAEVAAARPIRVKILPRAEAFAIPDLIRTKINLLPEGIAEVRTVEIVGLDLQADGGTHVANTAEVGRIRVVDYKSKGKINKRIEIAVE
ncbi:MAG: alanyl-tRNA editing protein [Chloroflexi bacterium]|nr:alanyl-tRNA editing protein [Chloroflexota bacterium]MBI5292113.1 alanyl-tRNA editing protein [Chloroflexota bacterium]